MEDFMNIQTFEAAFYDRLKQTPADFIFNKLKAGTDREAALYVYSISAHAIAQAKNCKAVPFEYYYPKEENSMKKTTQYNKLVRDRIPERIEKSGNHAEVTVLDEKTYREALDNKLQEKLDEYRTQHSLEALADLLEIMGAVVTAQGFTWNDLRQVRQKKQAEYGGFNKQLFLKTVTEEVKHSK